MADPAAQEAFRRGDEAAACGRWAEAVTSYQEALAGGPCPEASNNLGNALLMAGRPREALAAFLAADCPEGRLNASVAARALGTPDLARDLLEQAVTEDPGSPLAWIALANLLKDLGRVDLALPALGRALDLDPGDPLARGNLAYLTPFAPGASPEALLQAARLCEPPQGAALRLPPAPPRSGGPLRVGYLSPDFRWHCQAFFTLPLFAHHDPSRVHVTAYATVARPDGVTERLKGLVPAWRDCARLDDAELAARIREDGIEVLVDLTMHMAGGRPGVLARKPAPIQVAWLAYPGTTGLSAVDARISDPYLDPPGLHDAHYAERTLHLPRTFWCYDPLAEGPEPGPLPARRNGRVTFGCLNNFCKVNAGVLALWARVLEAVPGSRLRLLAPEGASRAWVLSQLPGPDRVDFVPFQARDAYLAEYREIDLCLDTLPYNGHTTSLDAFWMGVPVVTRVGATVVGRAGWSQLQNLGLPGLAAWDDDAFVAAAAGLAGDLDRLEALRRDLRPRMVRSPLMDAPAFARDLEDVLLRAAGLRA